MENLQKMSNRVFSRSLLASWKRFFHITYMIPSFVNFYVKVYNFQISITFFKNRQNEKGVVIDHFNKSTQLKNIQRENAPKYDTFEGPRAQNDYMNFDTTGPIDKNGVPIRVGNDTKDRADPSRIHDEDSNIEDSNIEGEI